MSLFKHWHFQFGMKSQDTGNFLLDSARTLVLCWPPSLRERPRSSSILCIHRMQTPLLLSWITPSSLRSFGMPTSITPVGKPIWHIKAPSAWLATNSAIGTHLSTVVNCWFEGRRFGFWDPLMKGIVCYLGYPLNPKPQVYH